MSIQQLLVETSAADFVDQHYLKLPYSCSQGASQLRHLGQWDVVDTILGQPKADVMVVREGQQRQGPTPTSATEAQSLVDEGFTVLVRHAEHHHEQLAKLAAGFRADFNAPVNIHIYITPGKQFGFGWHYDAEEVFIVQTSGCKEYCLRKNTVNPWPLAKTIPADMQYEREIMPLMRCTLSAGDWLYIPSGYWHQGAVVSDEIAVSLAIGVMASSAIDILDFLRPRLLTSMLWRQRLPTIGIASQLSREELTDRYRELFDQLSRDLRHCLSDEHVLNAAIEHFTQRD